MNHNNVMLTINQVAETDGGEADECVVHAVEVRPISLDVAEQYGGQQEEYGDSGHHVNKHVEQDLLAGALLFALELFKLKYSFERDENKSQEHLNTQGITFLPKKAPSVPMRMPLMGTPSNEYNMQIPLPSWAYDIHLAFYI